MSASNNPTSDIWPLSTDDGPPLAWWRMLSVHQFRYTEQSIIGTMLQRIAVLHGGDKLRAALSGDPAAAIAAALSLMPIRDISLTVDITMTALLHSALSDDPAAMLVLSHVLGRLEFDLPFKVELATLWLTHHIHYAKATGQSARTEAMVSLALCEEDLA
ncbi:hypothetical protein ACVIWV_000333 [Bradyrhizobium diazoefficiens]|jgi:hypothetical protein|nr:MULTISPECIES: hypothetical protein [Bradyrhizobium]MBR0868007.1 hypothetical protein [Bradyrhizobium diazoefficiens]MBR0892524.1 hypothetical protein [Bradyrhizobium diazoefficiens]MBR0924251.1 hypothetical protein [Bradyrhizobium diazoefficiens]MDA9541126.1 hypothetical protein [Bradyrhizobium sp. CCBAU 21362]